MAFDPDEYATWAASNPAAVANTPANTQASPDTFDPDAYAADTIKALTLKPDYMPQAVTAPEGSPEFEQAFQVHQAREAMSSSERKAAGLEPTFAEKAAAVPGQVLKFGVGLGASPAINAASAAAQIPSMVKGASNLALGTGFDVKTSPITDKLQTDAILAEQKGTNPIARSLHDFYQWYTRNAGSQDETGGGMPQVDETEEMRAATKAQQAREDFKTSIQRFKEDQGLAAGQVQDTGLLADLSPAKPSTVTLSPAAQKAAGVESGPVEKYLVDAAGVAQMPENIPFALAPNVPGVAAALRGTGKAIGAVAAPLEAAAEAIPHATMHQFVAHPLRTTILGATRRGLQALPAVGEFVESSGDLAAGAAPAENASALGIRAKQALAGAVGGTAIGVATSPADPEGGALGGFGMGLAGGALHGTGGAKLAGKRAAMEAQGAALRTGNEAVDATHDAMMATFDPSAQAAINRQRAALAADDTHLVVTNQDGFNAALQANGQPDATGARGMIQSDDQHILAANGDGSRTIYLNAEAITGDKGGLAVDTAGHEIGHGIVDYLQQGAGQAGADAITQAVDAALTSQEKADIAAQYKGALDANTAGGRVDPTAETIAEITRKILGNKDIADFGLPQTVGDKIKGAIADFFKGQRGDSAGMLWGTPEITKAKRLIESALYDQGARSTALRQRARDVASGAVEPNVPERQQQIATRLAEIGSMQPREVTPSVLHERENLMREAQRLTDAENERTGTPTAPQAANQPSVPQAAAPAPDRATVSAALRQLFGVRQAEADAMAAAATGSTVEEMIASAAQAKSKAVAGSRTTAPAAQPAPLQPAGQLAGVAAAAEPAAAPAAQLAGFGEPAAAPKAKIFVRRLPDGTFVDRQGNPVDPRTGVAPEAPNLDRGGAAAPPEAPARPVVTPEDLTSRVQAAEDAARAAEAGKKRRTPESRDKATAQAVKEARIQALLDAAHETAPDEGHLQRREEFGTTKYTGRIDESIPAHRMLLDELGVSEGGRANIDTLSANLGKPVFIKYKSAAKEGSSEAAQASGQVDRTGKQRAKEYKAESVDSRIEDAQAGDKNTGVEQTKSFYPLGFRVNPSTGSVTVIGFSPQRLLANVGKIVEFMRGKGRETGYSGPHDPAIHDDMQGYAQNHANNYKGDGSGPIEGETPNANYEPYIFQDHTRFDLLNAAMGNESAKTPKSDREGAKARAGDLQDFAAANNTLVTSEGETNPLRQWLNDNGFEFRNESGEVRQGTKDVLEPTIESLRVDPELMRDISTEAPEGEASLRPTGVVDPSAMTAAGIPKARNVAAGFMPGEGESEGQLGDFGKEKDEPSIESKVRVPPWERGPRVQDSKEVFKPLRDKIKDVAQEVYDAWDASDTEHGDAEVGFGGICQDIAEQMAGVLSDHGIEAYTQDNGGMGEQHVWVIAKMPDGVWEIDIPPNTYETGGGYNWKKIEGVKFGPDDVVIHRLDADPNSISQYVEDYQGDDQGETDGGNFMPGQGKQLEGFDRKPKTDELGFYSRLRQHVDEADFGRSKPKAAQHWLGVIEKWAKGASTPTLGVQSRGIARDELEWSGIKEWLQSQGSKPIKKADVLNFLDHNGVKVEEVQMGGGNAEGDAYWMDDEVQDLSYAFEDEHDGAWEINAYPSGEDGESKSLAAIFQPKNEKAYKIKNEGGEFVLYSGDGRDYSEEIGSFRTRQEAEDALNEEKESEKSADPVFEIHDSSGGSSYQVDTAKTFEEAVRKAREIASKRLRELNEEASGESAGDTQFSGYKLPGGSNYKEILLTLPRSDRNSYSAVRDGEFSDGSPRWKVRINDVEYKDVEAPTLGDAIVKVKNGSGAVKPVEHFTDSHWSKPNVVAHFRQQNFEGQIQIGTGEDKTLTDERVRHIDEIQSDWHQKGRERGYKSKDTPEFIYEVVANDDSPVNEPAFIGSAAEAHAWVESNGGYGKWEKNRRMNPAYRAGVPDAPFKKSWAQLAFKRALKLAVEDGNDRMSWSTGDQNIEHYKSALVAAVDKIDWKGPDEPFEQWAQKAYGKDTDLSKMSETLGADTFETLKKQHSEKTVTLQTTSSGPIKFNVSPDGTIFDAGGARIASQMEGKKLSEVIGKENADKIMQPGSGSMDGEGMEVGGEGMRTFYDEMIPQFAKKYVEKWGSKVEDVVLPNGETVHSVEITPEMKAAVEQGQPMFMPGKGPEKPAGDLSDFGGDNEPSIESKVEWAQPKRAKSAGDVVVNVKTSAFDEAFQKDFGFYIDKDGNGEIKGRRDRFKEFLKEGKAIEMPEVVITKEGTAAFVNGRHRFSVMRDSGVESIPMSMDETSALRAQSLGMTVEGKSKGGDLGSFMPSDETGRGEFDVKEKKPVDERRARLMADMQGQAKWLTDRAKEKGFDSVDDLMTEDFEGYNELAKQWREEHPRFNAAGEQLFMPGKMEGATPEEREANFSKWTGDAPVIRVGDSLHDVEPGQPVVIEGFHGTTHDFTAVDTSKANIENDWGKGFYVTNTPEDVENNYAGEGPDLTARIGRKAEQIESNTEGMDVDEIMQQYGATREEAEVLSKGDPEHTDTVDTFGIAKKLAKAQMTTHGGSTMKVFVKLENPLKLGGKEEYWDSEYPMDEEGEITGDPKGKMVDFIEALRDVARDYDGEPDWSMLDESMDGTTPSEAIKDAQAALGYLTDPETGELASKEIIRAAIERMGYDGILDGTVNEKFGSARAIGKQMEGMHDDTFHVIAFKPESVKSATGNRGTFEKKNPDMTAMPGTAPQRTWFMRNGKRVYHHRGGAGQFAEKPALVRFQSSAISQKKDDDAQAQLETFQ